MVQKAYGLITVGLGDVKCRCVLDLEITQASGQMVENVINFAKPDTTKCPFVSSRNSDRFKRERFRRKSISAIMEI